MTDDRLRHLQGLVQLQQLVLGNNDMRLNPTVPRPISPITDAGLIHLKGLTRLINLNLDGLPITDAGLDALKDLPNLAGLHLSRTRIKGPGLARLKSLPALSLLYLDQTEITDQGLGSLAGASNLFFLSLDGVPLTVSSLKVALKGLPRLGQLQVNGCGLLDEEVINLRKSKPELKIERR